MQATEHTNGLVALTVGCLALGTYIRRDLIGGPGIALSAGAVICGFSPVGPRRRCVAGSGFPRALPPFKSADRITEILGTSHTRRLIGFTTDKPRCRVIHRLTHRYKS
jgi:hypothetical protein